ncbi:hypothetical protein DPMN_007980 [Dreissena polymorpha]|uniref:Ammonium transporter AmtB-like domain-containing protein n=1 Tax=Dreissena polymorpha TaxID=45954 RepID=A0A9D4RYQ8_DREPO|nr:hypothetical protein DPMN_007980 [Dreissena polymorpha]
MDNSTLSTMGNDTLSAPISTLTESGMTLETLATNLDQFFLIIMGMCVIFMQGGFAFLEAGAVRSKNITNILMKNVLDLFVCGVAYWLFGYAFAWGKGNTFIGYTHFASHNLPATEYANFFYQFTFAATASTIISGAVAERCDFIAFLIYSFGITSFIYPVVTHWVWAGGFLSAGMDYGGSIGVVGFRDFAGSGVVHLLGGTAAFVGASIVGPRLGRFDKETKTVLTIRGHSVPIAALGGFILFFGFSWRSTAAPSFLSLNRVTAPPSASPWSILSFPAPLLPAPICLSTGCRRSETRGGAFS